MKATTIILCLFFILTKFQLSNGEFKAAATIVDVTPKELPVIVNGGMISRRVDKVKTPLNARAIALADNQKTIIILVVDSCMMPRPLLDQVKWRASRRTGIPMNHMLISATHTHSAGSCMGALGTPPDPKYTSYLKDQLVETIVKVSRNLRPAKIGFTKTNAPEFTAVRRWIHRPDRLKLDPFGNPTVRANMHSGSNWENVTGESGPEDPELSLISIQTIDNQQLAVLANFSMHYFSGEQGISADYFGLYCDGLKEKLAPGSQFVGIMSHGCSGDIWRHDYTKSQTRDREIKIEHYSKGLVDLSIAALKNTDHKSDVNISMAEQRMQLNYRTPNKQMLEWAQRIVGSMGDRLPKTREEVYAQEQIILHNRQSTEVVTQAIRIGDIAIATTPNETYAITGLKIKAASPLEKTMVIELANGGDGYIPPPEQHLLGGYNTWAARSAGLEVMAEPKIAESCQNLLETVADKARRRPRQSLGRAANSILGLSPAAWYRLDEFAGPVALDSSPLQSHAIYESEVTYYLEGPHSKHFCENEELNRSAMFVGGRLHCRQPQLGKNWSASVWLWNGMPKESRAVLGWFLSQGENHGLAKHSLHLGVAGQHKNANKLILQKNQQSIVGSTEIPRWQWQHVIMTRQENEYKVYLNGQLEITLQAETDTQHFESLFFGGRTDNESNWEGRLDEIAIFHRTLSEDEITKLSNLQ